MATPGAHIDRDKNDHLSSKSITHEDTAEEEEYTDQDSVVTDHDQFMTDIRMKLSKQDGRLDQLQRSLFGVEERIGARLDKEKEYLRDRLLDSMKLILDKLSSLSSGLQPTYPHSDSKLNPSTITEHPMSCSQSIRHQSSQQNGGTDDLTKPYSDSDLTDLTSLVTSVHTNLKVNQENGIGVSTVVTEGLNRFREGKIGIVDDELKLKLEKTDGVLSQQNTPTDVTTDTQENISDVNYFPFTSLSEQTNDLREETLHKFEEQKQLLVTEMKTLRKEISQSNTSVLKGMQFSITFFLLCFMGNCVIWLSLSPTQTDMHRMFNNNDYTGTTHLNNIRTLQAIDLSREHIRHELASLVINITTTMDYSITSANDVLMKRIEKWQQDSTAVNNKLKTDNLESNQTTSNDINKWKTNFIAEVKSSIDKQVLVTIKDLEKNMELKLDQQLLYLHRDLADIIEKEAQITREYSNLSSIDQRKVYEFIFRVRRFQDRVGSGLEVFSLPWYVPQFETSLKGLVRFLADGKVFIRLVNGRYPKMVGLQPKPKKSFTAEVRVIDEVNTEKSELLSRFRAKLDEQTAVSDSWGWDVGKIPSDEFLQQGFVKYDTLVIKYIIKL